MLIIKLSCVISKIYKVLFAIFNIKMRYKLFVLTILVFASLIGIVSAATCTDDQTIMKLFSPSNAHGEIYNGAGSYTTEICYNEIFGANGNGVHSCSGTNKIINLFSSTNAHAEIPTLSTYTTPVCYGDLTCTARPNTCNTGEKMVIALFSDTNSHLTDPSYKPSGMVSWWRLDDGTGTVASDVLNNNPGTLNNMDNSDWVDGKIGKALSFDGSNEYVSVPDNNNLDLTVFSLEAWFNLLSLPSQEEGAQLNSLYILSKSEDTTNGRWNYALRFLKRNEINSGNPVIACDFEESSDMEYLLTYPAGSLVGSYHHIVCTLNGNTWKMYIDGLEVSGTIYRWTSIFEPVSALSGQIPVTGNSPLYIGTHYSSNADGGYGTNTLVSFFDGTIDEVAIYNRALTAEEIQHRYNTGAYEKKICCKTAAGTGDKYWENMQGAKIRTADKKDSVKMTIEGLATGANIDYEIRRNVIFPLEDDIAKSGSFVAQGNKDYIIWVAGYDNVDEDVFKDGTYHFRIKINSGNWITTKSIPGGELAVSATEQNTPPKAVILTPQMDVTEKKIGETISFTQASYDPDDELQVTWDFGDGTPTVTKSNCQTQNCDTTHPYDTQNTYVISLTAKEINRLQKDIDHTRIFVYKEGTNPFPVITKPAPGDIIGGTGIIEFNASGSFVAKCAENTCPPDKPAEQTCYSVNSLQCYYLHPKGGPKGTGYQLWFNWTFSEGEGKFGNWDNYGTTPVSETGVVKFIRPFFQPITHYAKLKLGYQALL